VSRFVPRRQILYSPAMQTQAQNQARKAKGPVSWSRFPAADGRWLLVTSAFHMPRAMGAFRKAGMTPEAWPVYDLDQASPRETAAVAKHEWLGLLAYWLRGRSSGLFPGPA
jgi:hypothetical protein